MKTTIKIALSLAIIAAIIIGVSPYYQLYRLKTAYDKGDYQTIVQAVDFDKLRENLKLRLHDKVSKHLVPKELESLGFNEAKLNNFAYAMIDGMVDKAITQDNAMRLARGDVSAAQAGLFAIIDMDNQQNSLSKPTAHHENSSNLPENNQNHDKNYQLSYCGIHCFSIKTQTHGKYIDIRMTRHGLIDWKIDDVILP